MMTPYKHETIFHSQYSETIVTTRLDLCILCPQEPSNTAEVSTRLSTHEDTHTFWCPEAKCSCLARAFAGAFCSEKQIYIVWSSKDDCLL